MLLRFSSYIPVLILKSQRLRFSQTNKFSQINKFFVFVGFVMLWIKVIFKSHFDLGGGGGGGLILSELFCKKIADLNILNH